MQTQKDIRASGVQIIGVSETGSRHESVGQPCQDAYAISTSREGVTLIAVADGLSSATHAEVGAAIAVREAVRQILPSDPEITDADAEQYIREACSKARKAVLDQAITEEVNPSSYATTLIVGLYYSGKVIIGHIGDGIAVGIADGKTFILSLPGQSEYANETACLVQHDWETALRISKVYAIEGFLMATDGCQGALAIRSGGGFQPHDPFILPLVSYIREKTVRGIDPTEDVRSLIRSKRMIELSGDDKTLVILLGPNLPAHAP